MAVAWKEIAIAYYIIVKWGMGHGAWGIVQVGIGHGKNLSFPAIAH
jgi:hypothetical protein